MLAHSRVTAVVSIREAALEHAVRLPDRALMPRAVIVLQPEDDVPAYPMIGVPLRAVPVLRRVRTAPRPIAYPGQLSA